jgi:proteasome activator subunit 4
LLSLLVEKTKSERGYTGTGRLITRTLHTLAGVYPLSGHFVNDDEWEDPSKELRPPRVPTKADRCDAHSWLDFQATHNLHWGKIYNAKDAVIDWHGLIPFKDTITDLVY